MPALESGQETVGSRVQRTRGINFFSSDALLSVHLNVHPPCFAHIPVRPDGF